MAGMQQGFRGWAAISPSAVTPIIVLCRPGAGETMPRNLDTPYPISNQAYGIINHADGLRFPTVQLPTVPMASWFTAANLNAWFTTRTSDDLAVIGNGGIDFADSSDATNGQKNILLPKGAGFTLSGSFQEPISMALRFMGTDVADTPAHAAPTTGLPGAPLQYDSISFSGGLAAQKITGFSITLDNQCTPNPELGNGLRPLEINAGIMNVHASFSTNGGAPLADGTTGTVTVGGVNFLLTNLICLDEKARRQQQGRVIRPYEYVVKASTTAFPIVIS